MNIKTVEQITGVSGQNIRFYEKAGLITPKRNPLNAYRKYEEEDIRRIKIIKMLRMLDMPLEQIRVVLDGEVRLAESLENQKRLLEMRMTDLRLAIEFCEELKKKGVTIANLDVDACLSQMGEKQDGFFVKWIQDYKDVLREEHERTFAFVPEGAITNKREFTDELFRYAKEKELELVITKESMYPEFTLEGVAYRAERNYGGSAGVPTAIVRCTRMDVEDDENCTSNKTLSGRKKWMRILHIASPGIIYWVILITSAIKIDDLFDSWQNIVFILLMLLLSVGFVIRNYYLYWNLDGEY